MSPSSFPREVLQLRQRLPSTGSLRSGSPASSVLLASSDFSESFRHRSVTVAAPYLDCIRRSLRSVIDATTGGQGFFLNAGPSRYRDRGDQESSQVPVKPLLACPALRPRRIGCASPSTAHPILPSVQKTTSAPRSLSFRGSITRPASPLCTLRSRGRPRTTQHSVPVGG